MESKNKLKKISQRMLSDQDINVAALSGCKYLITVRKTRWGIALFFNKVEGAAHNLYAVTYCGKDDMVTFYPEKDKWSAASYFNEKSNDIGLSDLFNGYLGYYYLYKTTITGCFASKEDINAAEKFFRNYQGEKLNDWISERQIEQLPDVFQNLLKYQSKVLENRKAKRNKAKEDKKDHLFRMLKPIPKKFENWVWNTALEDTQFGFYKPINKTTVHLSCSVCQGENDFNRSAIKGFGQYKTGKCPMCGKKITFKPLSRQPGCISYHQLVSFLQKTPEGFVWRDYRAERWYDKDKLPAHRDRLTEECRWFISSNGTSQAYMESWKNWRPVSDGFYAESKVYPGNLPDAYSSTRYKYCGLEIIGKAGISMRSKIYMELSIEYPVLEKLLKAGFLEVVRDKCDYRFGSGRLTQHKASTIYDALKLPRGAVRRLQRMNLHNNLRALNLFQQCDAIINISDNEILEILSCPDKDDVIIDLAKRTGQTTHKVVSYCKSQSFRFKTSSKRETTPFEEAVIFYRDYITAAINLGRNMRDPSILRPSNLRVKHDEFIQQVKEIKDHVARMAAKEKEEYRIKEMQKREKAMQKLAESNGFINKALHLTTKDGFFITGLWTPADLRIEGNTLNHCVASYADLVAEGKTQIYGVRRISEPKKPLYTLEYKDGKIIQFRAAYNKDPEEGAWTLVKKFDSLMKKGLQSA